MNLITLNRLMMHLMQTETIFKEVEMRDMYGVIRTIPNDRQTKMVGRNPIGNQRWLAGGELTTRIYRELPGFDLTRWKLEDLTRLKTLR